MAHAPRPDPQNYRGGSTNFRYKEDIKAWEQAHGADGAKPDPNNYRGGSTNRKYKADLKAWEDAQEEVVSLNSSFDEEADPFAPEPDFSQAGKEGPNYGSNYEPIGSPGEEVFISQDSSFDETEADYIEQFEDIGEDGLPVNWPRREDGSLTTPAERTPEQQEFVDRWLAWKQSLLEEERAAEQAAFFEENPNFNLLEYSTGLQERYASISEEDMEERVRDVLNQHDPNRGDLEGISPEGYIWDNLVGKPWVETVRKSGAEHAYNLSTPLQLDLPPGYTYDDSKLYMKLPEGGGRYSMMNGFSTEEQRNYNQMVGGGDWIDLSGGTAPPGAYTMVYVKKPEQSTWVKFREDLKFFGRLVLNIVTGGASEAIYAGIRAARGETLHGEDWANIVTSGLNIAGIEGFKLGDIELTTAQRDAAIRAIGSGDPVEALLAIPQVGDQLNNILVSIGIPPDVVQDPDFQAGLRKGLSVLGTGGNFEEALKEGLSKYIREGGGFGGGIGFDFDGMTIDLGIFGETLSTLAEQLREAGSNFDDTFIQPVVDAAEPVVDVVEDVVETTGDVIQDVTEPIVDAADEVIDTIGEEVVDPALEAAEEFVESIEGPDIDLPDVDLPDVDLPDLPLDSLFSGLGMAFGQLPSKPSATRTTDSLFKRETEPYKPVKYTRLPMLSGTPPRQQPKPRTKIRRIETPTQQPQREEVVDLNSNPFESPFDRKIG